MTPRGPGTVSLSTAAVLSGFLLFGGAVFAGAPAAAATPAVGVPTAAMPAMAMPTADVPRAFDGAKNGSDGAAATDADAFAAAPAAEFASGFIGFDIPARADIRDHLVTIALVAPAGTEPSFDADEARRSLELVDQFYDRETDGAIRFVLEEVQDWQHVDEPIDCTDTGGLHEWVRQKTGWQPGPARHLVIMVPPGEPCPGWANGEQPGDPDDGGGTFQPGPDPYFLAHELGHNLSLPHAFSIRCETGWDYPAGVDCPRDEYGNRTDMMGGAWSFLPLSSPTLARLGVLRNVREPRCGDARTAVLDSLGAGPAGARTLTWTDPENPDARYWVQYSDRADSPSDSGASASSWEVERAVSGVQILRSNPDQPYGGDLLERPGDPTEANEFVRAGETVALNSAMTVHVDEIDEAARRATVTVSVPCADPAAARDITGSAVPTASYVPDWSSAAAAVDGEPVTVWSTWPQVGEQWLELVWDAEVQVDRVSVVVARDAADDEARGLIPPRGWRVERWDAAAEAWAAVPGAVFAPADRAAAAGEVSFDRVATSALRIVFDAWGDAEYTGSTGVAEVSVFGALAAVDPQPPLGPQPPVDPQPPVGPQPPVDPNAPVTPVDPVTPVAPVAPGISVPRSGITPAGSSVAALGGTVPAARSLAETGGGGQPAVMVAAAVLSVLAGGGVVVARRRAR